METENPILNGGRKWEPIKESVNPGKDWALILRIIIG